MSERCIFCDIIKKKIPSKIELEEKELIAFQDVNPKAPVHLLIIPREHIPLLDELKPKHLSLIGKMVDAACRLAKEKGLTEGYRLVWNNGVQAGQSVFHIHLHLLGGRAMHWPPG